jgi:parvulin-like peptidyl-prolyl isomerase
MNRRTWMACLGLLVAAGAASPTPAVVAVVGGVPIGMADLEAALKQADPMPVQRTERGQTQLRLRVLGTLIDEALMRKFLEANTKPVDPAEVQRRLASMEEELRLKDRSLAEFCLETRKTIDQLQAEIADRIRWSRYEAEKLTDATLAQCYNRNKDLFDGVTVRASHIVVRVSAGASEAEKAAAREKLLGLRKRLRDDPKLDFDELAKSQPDKGGDLESIPRRWFDEQFSRAAYALPPGEVSDIVQTDFGMHLIKVTERRPGKTTETENIHRAVRECCAEELRQKILAHQRKTVEVKVNLP